MNIIRMQKTRDGNMLVYSIHAASGRASIRRTKDLRFCDCALKAHARSAAEAMERKRLMA